MIKTDPLCKDAYISRDRAPLSPTPRLIQAYGLGADDASKGLKDNPYPETSGLHDAYEEGWRDRTELTS